MEFILMFLYFVFISFTKHYHHYHYSIDLETYTNESLDNAIKWEEHVQFKVLIVSISHCLRTILYKLDLHSLQNNKKKRILLFVCVGVMMMMMMMEGWWTNSNQQASRSLHNWLAFLVLQNLYYKRDAMDKLFEVFL